MRKPSSRRPDRLAVGGTRQQAAIDMRACLERLLAEARHAERADDAVPAGPFLMRVRGEACTPFHRAPGRNRLRMPGNDDAGLAERKPTVSAAAPNAKSPAALSP